MPVKQKDLTLELIEKALDAFPEILRRKDRAMRSRLKVMKNFKIAAKEFSRILAKQAKDRPVHPWRLCPIGNHWVKIHSRVRPVTGGQSTVHGHCRANRSKKDELSAQEIAEIAERHFSKLEKLPRADDLGFRKRTANGNAFDLLIAGWTQYWNEIFRPAEPLDPNLVKALIASESGFAARITTPMSKSRRAFARGLLQLTDETISIIANPKGELKDFLVLIDKESALDPNVSIAAGIRWLFHKKELAKKKLGREPSWDEAVGNYKSYLQDMIKDPTFNERGMKVFRDHYRHISQ